jgi:hypothetical protein
MRLDPSTGEPVVKYLVVQTKGTRGVALRGLHALNARARREVNLTPGWSLRCSRAGTLAIDGSLELTSSLVWPDGSTEVPSDEATLDTHFVSLSVSGEIGGKIVCTILLVREAA